jgi:hypothetical protein
MEKKGGRGETLQVLESMQTIYPVALTPREYADLEFHKQVLKPENCANCRRANCLEALGYYQRWASFLEEFLRIWVRRFRCLRCKVSISCLPDFVQPYRALNTATLQAGFNQEVNNEVIHWGWLIEVYWKKFTAHLPRLLQGVGCVFGPCAPGVGPREFWDLLMSDCQDLARATGRLVHEFKTCLFGTYRCHQKRSFSE